MVNTPIDLDYLHTNEQPTVSNPLEHVVMLPDSDLTRVAKGVKFDIESIYDERGGFWITESQSGFIDSRYGAPCGWENFKSAFYYEDVLNEQKRLAT